MARGAATLVRMAAHGLRGQWLSPIVPEGEAMISRLRSGEVYCGRCIV